MYRKRKNVFIKILISGLLFTATTYANESSLVSSAKGLGFTKCISTVKEMQDFFADKAQYGHLTIVAQDNPNGTLLTTSLEIVYSDGSTLVDLTVVPNTDNTCSYTYTRTLILNDNCMSVSRSKLLEGYDFTSPLSKDISTFQNKDNVKIFLLPIPSGGCLLQKKEIAYRLKK